MAEEAVTVETASSGGGSGGAANAALRPYRYGLLVHDGYCPWSVTKMFLDASPEGKHIFVANPAERSKHNRGAAVDLTLYGRSRARRPRWGTRTAIDVTVPTPAGHVLAGTLTLPKTASREHRVGAVVTITGSGPKDRDEGMASLGYRPFYQLADSLGRRGIAVLRMDDRGTGASGGVFKGATSWDFAEDARAGLAYLRTRTELDATRLAVAGHSEGAVIAPMVANREPTLRAIVLLAGVAHPARSALHFQIANMIQHDTSLHGAQRDSALAAVPACIDTMSAHDP